MLQRGEQRVELGEVGAMEGFELVDLGDASGELSLTGNRRQYYFVFLNVSLCDCLPRRAGFTNI